MKIEYPMKLTFMLEEQNNVLTNAFVVDDCEQWTTLIIKFADFLNAQYGYDIKEKIVFVNDFALIDKWSVIGERTISQDAYNVAKGFDADREEALWEDDEE
jgi:hypothetical protein